MKKTCFASVAREFRWNRAGVFGGLASLVLLAGAHAGDPAALRDALRSVTGTPRGWVVVIESPECAQLRALADGTEYRFYQQFASATQAQAARARLHDARLLGTRAFVGQGARERLLLADNLADAVIVAAGVPAPPHAEILRVLRPGGRAWLPGGKTLTKPAPPGVDDWSHPYHGPDNNPLSRDQVIRAPYLTQFLADPRYAPMPQLAVAAAGRVFKAYGHLAFKDREEPLLNTLAAYNGYNGAPLWRQPIAPGIMIHRNVLIATADRVYFGDDRSCKVYDAATGALRDEITLPPGVADGPFWKWMALEDGVLYALVGRTEQRDPVIRQHRHKHGWPWDPLSPGYNQPENPWGYGRTLVALDPDSKKVLWSHREEQPLDSRALCLSHGRLFVFRFGEYLVALDARTGKELWRRTPENAPKLFTAFGKQLNRQDWRTNWRTTAYTRATERAVYFSGPTIGRLIAVNAATGDLLWTHPSNNYQLIARDEVVYGFRGQIDSDVSRAFDPWTGKVLAELVLGRRACALPTGCPDSIFFRASGGSVRLDVANNHFGLISPMRAQCQDGVTIANGLLYWWPSVCDCNLTLYGITALGPAGDFDFDPPVEAADRLTVNRAVPRIAPLPADARDWPQYRANPTGTVVTEAVVPATVVPAWTRAGQPGVRPTAATAISRQIFFAASDGSVQSLDAATGKPRWRTFTGGAVRFPPTLAKGRAYVGSGDGSVYCLSARDGRLLWRFQAAPAPRLIPVYGRLMSTWPAAGGVLVQDGVAYVAAGIVNYDGTHVYALDAATGALKWHNGASGFLDPEARAGVSVQGYPMIVGDRLYLPGGNAVSPAVYDLATGRCLNEPDLLHRTVNNHVPASLAPRGSELFLVGGKVFVSDKPLYAHPRWPVYDNSVLRKTLVTPTAAGDLLWVNNAELLAYDRIEQERNRRLHAAWGKPQVPDTRPRWRQACPDSRALAVGRERVVVALPEAVVAYDLRDGRECWRQPLPAPIVPWGLALDRDGRVIASLENGDVRCFGPPARLDRQ
jgi:outer membrane protein assembly factor BamB